MLRALPRLANSSVTQVNAEFDRAVGGFPGRNSGGERSALSAERGRSQEEAERSEQTEQAN